MVKRKSHNAKMVKQKTPKNKCWIVAVGNDDFNYWPSMELISAVKKHNKKNKDNIRMYRTEKYVQKICDALNSM